MDEKEKQLRQNRASLMRECAAIEDRITEGVATDGDKERLTKAKEELVQISSKLAEISERRPFTKRTGFFGALGKAFGKKAKELEPEELKVSPWRYTAKVLSYSILVLALVFGTIAGVILYETGPRFLVY